jgi:hypothetical protein
VPHEAGDGLSWRLLRVGRHARSICAAHGKTPGGTAGRLQDSDTRRQAGA